MKVSELRATLSDLLRLLESAGAKSDAIREIRAFADGLTRFDDQPMKAFTALLAVIDSDGKIPASPKKDKEKKSKPPPIRLDDLLAEARFLYEHAADKNATQERAETFFARLQGITKKPDMVAIAGAIEIAIAKKTIPVLRDEIQRRISDRMGATIRRQLLDRPNSAEKGVESNDATAVVS